MNTVVESWRLKCITDAYLFGFYSDQERQSKAGEEYDHDKAIRAGKAVERAVEKIVGKGPA